MAERPSGMREHNRHIRYATLAIFCYFRSQLLIDSLGDLLIKLTHQFSKDNYQHPVYKAIIEIGKASKTIFLCRCLMSEELRIEIHEAQNVVERLNSVMGFIFYGKLGEISTNVKEYQELSIVCQL